MFFDNLKVTHTAGHILEETHYYPYGLAMAGISTKALNNIAPNNYKFNAGNEHNENFGINLYETFYRLQDVQTGRFLNTDPLAEKYYSITTYNYAANNPVSINDPLGDQMKYPGDNGRMQKGPDGNYHAAWFSSFMWENKNSFNFGLSWGSSGGGSAGIVFNLFHGIAKGKDQRYSLESATDKNGIEGIRISWWEEGSNEAGMLQELVGHSVFLSNSSIGEQQQNGGDGWNTANTVVGATSVVPSTIEMGTVLIKQSANYTDDIAKVAKISSRTATGLGVVSMVITTMDGATSQGGFSFSCFYFLHVTYNFFVVRIFCGNKNYG